MHLTGPRGRTAGRFVLDTGAVATTMVPELADTLGYSVRDAFKRTRVHTAIGEEEGYVIRVGTIEAMGFVVAGFPVNVFDLGHGIDGLLGMNFLLDFNVEMRPAEQRLLVEKITP